MSKTISPHLLYSALRNRAEIMGVVDDVSNAALNGLIDGPERQRERESLAHIRLEIETALADLDDVARQIADPTERAMLTSVAFRLLAGGSQLGRFSEPLAFTKALQARRASTKKAEGDKARREALDPVVARVIGKIASVSDEVARLVRPRVLSGLGLPVDTPCAEWPSVGAIRKSLSRIKGREVASLGGTGEGRTEVRPKK